MKNATTQARAVQGDCLVELARLEECEADLVYLDPPFFTNRRHSSISRDRINAFSFDDAWGDLGEYADFMEQRLREAHRVLKHSGSIFVHCDTSANFLLRTLLNNIFGASQFRSEIIWSYKRWSNSARNLLPAHQTILFYSKSDAYKFNVLHGSYSETTNVDQILQLRQRDADGVSKYATDKLGNTIYGTEKNGVPLNDVWAIPFLNPKAKERTGYPTQKPILLLERIIEISTDPGDFIVDPFCGSGTTLVAAAILGRRAFGIDTSREAVALANRRIEEPVRTDSALLKKGRLAYATANLKALAVLEGLDFVPVHRNSGIDAFLRSPEGEPLVPVRVQRNGESISDAAASLARAAISKKAKNAILVRTNEETGLFSTDALPPFMHLIESTALRIKSSLDASLIAGETKSAANNSFKPKPLRGSA
ncbi:site-specific DNA-methyltransferase [Xanthomonas campestris pv. badrii]|uniref:Methyltransferase n=2 Tax=Xanthomonas campestris TaxID=339 RepID=A0A7Z2ZHC4_XANCA|nr:site-specific DNA-methyltransferase [Xanthomonas campestris]AAC08984.1 DNA modification methyltransferase M.XbaI [Xanthomonas campestris]QJD68038.1 site-specific DNA-methyltransferase [Xanthomonas campestris pv. badrii]